MLIYTILNDNFAMSTVFILSYVILLISFTAIFIHLYASTLKRTRDFDEMKEQNKDILLQYLVFTFGFILKIILSHLMIHYSEEVQDTQVVFIQFYLQALSHIFVDILPITVILWVQQKTYRKGKTM